jgi:Holliday junction resolvase RusA-like endonuclease
LNKTKFVFDITPVTWVRVTFNDRWFFRIPFDKLSPAGKARRLRLDKYNDYKHSLLAEAKRLRFDYPNIGAGIMFCLPMPKKWSKKKRRAAHGNFHDKRPDLKNLLSAFEDALMAEDKGIAYYTHLGKRWVDSEKGWIEVTVTDPSRISLAPPLEGDNRLI